MDEAARERQRYMWREQKRRQKIAQGLAPKSIRLSLVTCVHCKIGRPNQRAGLCSTCYWDPQIVALYP